MVKTPTNWAEFQRNCNDELSALSSPAWQSMFGHLHNLDVTPDQHSAKRRLAIGRTVMRVTRIYLDQSYWIYCRNARAGISENRERSEIDSLLTALSQAGKIVCPISYASFEETAKQAGDKRKLMAELIDCLSKGIVLRSPFERIATEFAFLWLCKAKGILPTADMREYMWTRPGYVTGEPEAGPSDLPPQIHIAVRKFMFDRLSGLSFSDALALHTNGQVAEFPAFDKLARQFNAADKAQSKTRSFATRRNDEVVSFLSSGVLREEPLIRATQDLLHDDLDRASMTISIADEANEFSKRIQSEFCQNNWLTEFPYLHIFTSLYAHSIGRSTRAKANDLWDYDHACAALPYCNAFFTESDLGTVLTQSPLRFDQLYGCRVLFREKEMIEYLRSFH